MIAIDASALVAILLNEPEADRLVQRISAEGGASMPQSAMLEAHIVARKQADPSTVDDLDDLLKALSITISAQNGTRHLAEARLAFDRYGKGRHPAKLNFGDCLVYGFARAEGLKLLFKGDDFAQTDIEPA